MHHPQPAPTPHPTVHCRLSCLAADMLRPSCPIFQFSQPSCASSLCSEAGTRGDFSGKTAGYPDGCGSDPQRLSSPQTAYISGKTPSEPSKARGLEQGSHRHGRGGGYPTANHNPDAGSHDCTTVKPLIWKIFREGGRLMCDIRDPRTHWLSPGSTLSCLMFTMLDVMPW